MMVEIMTFFGAAAATPHISAVTAHANRATRAGSKTPLILLSHLG